MRRIPWDILFALLVGLGAGLVYAWMIAPRGATDTQPRTLRADFKDQYRSLIAAAYAATGNLPRVQETVSLGRVRIREDFVDVRRCVFDAGGRSAGHWPCSGFTVRIGMLEYNVGDVSRKDALRPRDVIHVGSNAVTIVGVG